MLTFWIGALSYVAADSTAAGDIATRRRLSRRGPIRRLAGQPWDLVVGRRDPGRLQSRNLQGSRPVPPHRQGKARGISSRTQPRWRRDLVGRGAAPAGVLAGTPGMRHGIMPPGLAPDEPTELRAPIRFDHPDFAMTVRMENSNNGMSRFFFSYDRGKNWQGPYRLPLFDQKGVMARTDYIVDGRSSCTLFLTASKIERPRGSAVLRPHGRRRSDLAVSLVHWSRARSVTQSCPRR